MATTKAAPARALAMAQGTVAGNLIPFQRRPREGAIFDRADPVLTLMFSRDSKCDLSAGAARGS
jgi:hypothetical protein